MQDILLSYDDNLKEFDIDFDDTGELVLDDGYNTALLLSIGTDDRADKTEVKDNYRRGGWLGKEINNEETPDLPYGSKLWLLGTRQTQRVKNMALDYARQCVRWFLDIEGIEDINVVTDFTNKRLELTIILIDKEYNQDSYNFKLFNNTELLV